MTGSKAADFTLVLGGGGATGLAFMCGALRAIREVIGVDPNDAELIIGTSAGSVMAADLRSGKSLPEIVEQLNPEAEAPVSIARAWRSYPDLARRLVGSAWIMSRTALPTPMRLPEPPDLLQRLFPGSMFVVSGDEHWATERYPARWPSKPAWIVTSDLDDGRRVVLRSSDNPAVSFAQAVRASCAVPGLYPPVRVQGRRLVDGGVSSVTNLDLAASGPGSLVIVLAPMGFDPSQPPGHVRSAVRRRFNAQLDRERRVVERAGKRVLILRPTGAELDVHGVNILDGGPSARIESAAFEATAARLDNVRVQSLFVRPTTRPRPLTSASP
jgi:NTE family protein